MKKMTIFLIFLLKIMLSLLEINGKKAIILTTSNKIKNDTSLTRQIREKCNAECSKLSKIYPCFCDLSCTEYGDCCKLFVKGCEDYFSDLLNDIKVVNISETKSNNTTFERSTKNNKTILVKYDHNGRCCHDKVEPFNCFCDSQCVNNGDCCVDYNYCVSRKFLSETNIKISARKKRDLIKDIIKSNNENDESIKEENEDDVYSFSNLKKILYKKIGIIDSNLKNEEKNIKKKSLGYYIVPSLTPQIGMTYVNNSRILLKYDQKIILEEKNTKKAPAIIKITKLDN